MPFYLPELPVTRIQMTTNVDRDVGERKPLYPIDGSVNTFYVSMEVYREPRNKSAMWSIFTTPGTQRLYIFLYREILAHPCSLSLHSQHLGNWPNLDVHQLIDG